MAIDRRGFIAGALAGPVLFHLSTIRAFAQDAASGARPASEVVQVTAAQNFRFGGRTVTALSDGFIDIPAEALAGIDAADASAILEERFAGAFPTPAGLNTFLVRGGEGTVLVDAGGAPGLFPTAGQLPAVLETVGVAADGIDVVLLTHLHPDHIGALVVDGGRAFPNAILRVHRAEIDYWMNDEAMAAAGPEVAVYFEAAREVVAAYGDRLRAFEGEEEVADGIRSRELFGHTPGHCGFMIGEDGDGLLIWGDVVHVAPVQFARPGTGMVFDVDPQQAIATREQLFREVADGRIRVAGMHVAFPGIGHLVTGEGADGGYRFEPERWQYTL